MKSYIIAAIVIILIIGGIIWSKSKTTVDQSDLTATTTPIATETPVTDVSATPAAE